MSRRKRKTAERAAPVAVPALPYTVRRGPWARNLYLGLPACLAFGLIFWSVNLSGWALGAMGLPIALLAFVCLLPRETRFAKDGRVVVQWKLLALLPVWRRVYALSDLRAVSVGRGETGFVGEASTAARTIFLVTNRGGFLPVQSDSAGADPSPSIDELRRILPALTGLPLG